MGHVTEVDSYRSVSWTQLPFISHAMTPPVSSLLSVRSIVLASLRSVCDARGRNKLDDLIKLSFFMDDKVLSLHRRLGSSFFPLVTFDRMTRWLFHLGSISPDLGTGALRL